ncbi:MAG: DUF1592 domain-containing protein [Myxococcota bacterium]
MSRLTTLLAWSLVACHGNVEAAPPFEIVTPPVPDAAPSLCDPADRGRSHRDSRRLTRREFERTLTALFGPSLEDEVSRAMPLFPEEAFDVPEVPKDFLPESLPRAVSEAHVDAMIQASTDLARRAAADPEFLAQYGCPMPLERACVATLLRNFTARAHRRPTDEAELERRLRAWDETGDLASLLQATLLSPRFAMLLEDGGEADGERVRLSDFEVAVRISYAAVEGPPDDLLWSAAELGELQTVEQVRAHVERLLESEAGRARVRRFFRSWMEIDPTSRAAVSDAFRGETDSARLYEDALADFDRFVDYVVWELEGTVDDLFTDRTVFPSSAELAELYGVVGSDGEPQFASTPHQGILLRAATLIGGLNDSPIILRGVFLRRRILCDTLGAADFDGNTPSEDDPAFLDRSVHPNRDVVAYRTRDEACMRCHAFINPLGFALEAFDSLGRFRTEDRVFDAEDLPSAAHPIETRAEALAIEDGARDEVDSAGELVEALLESDKLRECAGRTLLRFHAMREDGPDDVCLLEEQSALARSATVRELLVHGIANEDIFWRNL